MIAEIIDEILAEVRLQKEAQESKAEEPGLEEVKLAGEASGDSPALQKISSEDAEYIKSKLSMLGLGKYAAYVDEINDVAGELVKALLSEMEKVASEDTPFRVSDRPDIYSSAIDPITKFALS